MQPVNPRRNDRGRRGGGMQRGRKAGVARNEGHVRPVSAKHVNLVVVSEVMLTTDVTGLSRYGIHPGLPGC